MTNLRLSAALPIGVAALSLLAAAPASAHHLMEAFQLTPSPLSGLLSGLGHPLLGPDHLLFLLALGLVGLQRPTRWVLGLLAILLHKLCRRLQKQGTLRARKTF
jgi:hydrogenase/urease accessory protein HupE